MNRYIIILTEMYDQFYVNIPHPIETSLNREEIVFILSRFYYELDAINDEYRINYRANYNNKSSTIRIPETDIILDSSDLEEWDGSRNPYNYRFKCPQIYTMDEFFKEYSNKRIN